MKRLAIITTHPIQYNAPWFRLLAERGNIAIKVFYTWSQVQKEKKFDPGFGKNVQWDIPLLEGYDFTFVENISRNPGSKSYTGIDNPTLIAEVKEWQPDAILIFGWKFKSHLKAIKYFHGRVPVLFRGDSHLIGRQSGIRNILRNWLLRNVFRKIDYALYVGAENKKYFNRNGLKDNRLVHVPHAVDNKRFRKTPESVFQGTAYRRQLQIGENDLVFLYAGKFEKVKNPLLLLEAAEYIKMENVHFVFAGNGHMENKMKESRSANIHFMDFQNQQYMPGLYQMCDVYVLPSLSETWGLAVNEAMAAGKPVLVSDVCGCASDLVVHGETGFVFQSGREIDLKAKIHFIITQKNNLSALGGNALEMITNFSFERNAIILEHLIKQIA